MRADVQLGLIGLYAHRQIYFARCTVGDAASLEVQILDDVFRTGSFIAISKVGVCYGHRSDVEFHWRAAGFWLFFCLLFGLSQQVVDVGRAVLVLDQRRFQPAHRHFVHHHLLGQQGQQRERDMRGLERRKFLVALEFGQRHLAQVSADAGEERQLDVTIKFEIALLAVLHRLDDLAFVVVRIKSQRHISDARCGDADHRASSYQTVLEDFIHDRPAKKSGGDYNG